MEKYNNLFKTLINSYHAGTFENTVKNIFRDSHYNKEKLAGIVSSLCGVEIVYSNLDEYITDLKYAIKNYDGTKQVIRKIAPCSAHCVDEDGASKCRIYCPFDAIIHDKVRRDLIIDHDKCTDCGQCVEQCENGNFIDKIEYFPLQDLLKKSRKVIIAVAPAIAGQFGSEVTLEKLRTAFLRLGFIDMVEVAFFADILTLKEAVEFNKKVKSKEDFLITSCCCPMWIGMLKKVYSQFVKDTSPSISPMIAAGRIIKKLNPDYKVVFVGPCVAKKAEAKEKDVIGDIDFVLTFEELKNIFEACEINLSELPETPSSEYASKDGRLYARTGGVSIAVSDTVEALYPDKADKVRAIKAQGVLECKQVLNNLKEGKIEGNFIEGMGCVGGCVGGPKALIPASKGKEFVDNAAYSSVVKLTVHNECMQSILEQIGIHGVDDFINEEHIDMFIRDFEA